MEYEEGIENENGGYLNVSLFSAFQELQHLNLSYGLFDGWMENEGFERLVGLRKLEVLDLSYNFFNDNILPSLAALTTLRTLSLAGNSLEGSFHLEGFERLTGLKKLEVLDLSSNFFNNSVLPSLATLKSLKILSLSFNILKGSSHFEELFALNKLQSLDLSLNSLNASSGQFQGFQKLVGLRKLEVLDLSYNSFNNSILPSLAALKSLRVLSLSNNNFQGFSHFQELFTSNKLQSLDLSYNSFNFSLGQFQDLCQLKHLQELRLRGNDFEGILPPCLQNLTTLRVLDLLDLSNNRFKGNIHSSLISSLTSLVSISLSYNDFDGLFSFITFANHSNLESIDLSSAGHKLKVETEFPSWASPFQLKVLQLSNSNLNATIPRFLTTQHNLIEIDLSSNNLTGMFPTWLLENNKMLKVLILKNNSLGGHFVLSNIHRAAYIMDISNNDFNGLLQENIGEMLPNLGSLNLFPKLF
ncbi:hypothetical protein NE237_025011 [Protea cynaroides]|uniref:Toll-like receptor 3 n=1 Tax=Protea cynaroides TaxID=273540 RepID=A0A9Q0H284_9MAGN|nr:hypothetical protein NE237_025011 [Protea cynaroides]